jgi:glycosyltransferase involved in cell wall biosynthesis
MNIGFLHYQLGGTDGVSLEIDKWKRVLEEMGHTVHLCAGDLGSLGGTLIPEMYHHTPEAERLYRNTFIALADYPGPDSVGDYAAELEQLAALIEAKLRLWVEENQIDFLIPNNIWSVAANPAVAPALANVMRSYQLPTVAHSHDFYWERVDGVALTCAPALALADRFLPPRDPLISHVVINSLAQSSLRERKGIESIVVPNVFDFDADHGWSADEYNADFRTRIGLRDNDLFILQATRIVPRKGIELAIDFVQALGAPHRRARLEQAGLYDGRAFTPDSRIVFVLAGYAQDDATGLYLGKLKRKVEESGVDALFIDEMVGGRRELRDGRKIYSLWDTYVYADFITYPSLWEGWGNQLLEAMYARLPFMLFEYPVYEADIKPSGIQAASLGAETYGVDEQGLVRVAPEVMEAAADQAIDLLIDNEKRQAMTAHNFQVGRRHYSLAALRGYLEQLVG